MAFAIVYVHAYALQLQHWWALGHFGSRPHQPFICACARCLFGGAGHRVRVHCVWVGPWVSVVGLMFCNLPAGRSTWCSHAAVISVAALAIVALTSTATARFWHTAVLLIAALAIIASTSTAIAQVEGACVDWWFCGCKSPWIWLKMAKVQLLRRK